ncbi:MAG: penicillin-binding protein 1B [Lamprobacter sp.]|uniref:penicillin-binding protein 1B n=1 Tax=Lamprobacter sp. TaxID=3100796 RepID=UPI002B25FE2B|nr:penicillin-binding protein 1B [Lamprobacter sp.]MEA3638977.1 penicillin-binding protein 1B [Lamprobacter sp.]
MAKAKITAPSPKRGRPRRRRGLGLWAFFFSSLLLLLIGVALALGLYGVQLDKVVREKFEGKRWALPARVYARPLELYVGRPIAQEALVGELERLKYRRSSRLERAGSFDVSGDHVRIRTRPFQFWDGAEVEQRVDVHIVDGLVIEMRSGNNDRDLALVRLDPALIASIYPTHNEDRVLLRRQQLPPLLVKTLLAVEDRSFFKHPGIDPKGIARAAYENLMAGRTVQGASTLTQQLVKNFYLTQERTLERKLKEAYMAVLLDQRYSKDEILTAYANEVYLGQDGSRGIHGFGLASRFYFDRDIDELNPSQIALLVGILKGPGEFNPRRNPERATERRNLVLDVMAYHQVISTDEVEAAKQAPLGIKDGGAKPAGEYPAFIQLVRRQLQRDYREADLRSEGLSIFTTLDPLIQSQTEAAIRERMPKLDQQRRLPTGTLETAAVVTSVAQGEVLAIVGGRNTDYAGFNRALDAVRSIGSAIKPVIYLAALAQPERFSLVSPIADKPISLRIGGKLWSPKNYDHRVHGTVPLYQALAKSYNLATVNLGLQVGVGEVAAMLRKLGAVRPVSQVPAMLLGSASLPPIELTQVYQTIAAGGFRAPLRAIREVLDASGQPLNRYPLAVEPVVSSDAAYLTQWAMRQVVEQGTATWLKQRLPDWLKVAGKTGTTNDMRDSWFAGFSGDRVLVVWVGRDDNQPMGLSGSSGALRLWGDIMAEISSEPLSDAAPDTIEIASACGSSDIPFSRGYASGGAACGGSGGNNRSTPKREDAEAPKLAQGEPADKPEPIPPPRRERAEARQNNPFMSDFYGN